MHVHTHPHRADRAREKVCKRTKNAHAHARRPPACRRAARRTCRPAWSSRGTCGARAARAARPAVSTGAARPDGEGSLGRGARGACAAAPSAGGAGGVPAGCAPPVRALQPRAAAPPAAAAHWEGSHGVPRGARTGVRRGRRAARRAVARRAAARRAAARQAVHAVDLAPHPGALAIRGGLRKRPARGCQPLGGSRGGPSSRGRSRRPQRRGRGRKRPRACGTRSA